MMPLRFITILGFAASISGCAGQSVVTTKSMEDRAKFEILRTARDPNAIEFAGPFAAGHRLNFTLVCGYANGTNAFGGHAGWTLVGVMFPDSGNLPIVLSDDLPPSIQCPLANANPPQPGVSEELKRKHGLITTLAK